MHMILIGKNEEERQRAECMGEAGAAGLETLEIKTMRPQRALDDGRLSE